MTKKSAVTAPMLPLPEGMTHGMAPPPTMHPGHPGMKPPSGPPTNSGKSKK